MIDTTTIASTTTTAATMMMSFELLVPRTSSNAPNSICMVICPFLYPSCGALKLLVCMSTRAAKDGIVIIITR